MNNRQRNLRKAMLSTYVEGKVWTTDLITGVLVPMEKDQIDQCIRLAVRDDSLTPVPFYYNAARGSYIQIMNLWNREKQHRIEMEKMSFKMKENLDKVTNEYDDRPFSKGETPFERHMRLIRENSFYGAYD